MNSQEKRDEGRVKLSKELPDQKRLLPGVQGDIAYELLMLQQRLDAYEQLHLEEMAELRREMARLRRAFLQETTPQLRAIIPKRPEL
ncbi:MAG TPA: hypothetical protein VGT44_14080 [Ktedonobacteraceae bacterium]|nr:hypothetical protein [Ktedonobacteraceae bacterium]